MNKFDDVLDQFYSWFLIALITTVHFFYLAGMLGEFNLDALKEVNSIIHLIFTTASSVMMTTIGADKGIELGLETEEFKLANELNNELNNKITPKRKAFSKYIRIINKEERQAVRENFLISYGALTRDELTKKQQKQYDKLSYTKHDVRDITLPLFFEKEKGNKINYGATFDPKKYKARGAVRKAFLGVLTGLMSVQLVVRLENFKAAFGTIMLVLSSLVFVYLMNRKPPFYKLQRELPNKVANKYSLWQGFENREDEIIELLKKEEEEKNKKEVEPEILYLPM